MERLNSTMHGFWGEPVNVGWREAMKILHIKGAVPLIAESSLIPSKVNMAQCMAKCENTRGSSCYSPPSSL